MSQKTNPPSKKGPANVPLEKTPVFVTYGFDDNGYTGDPGSGAEGGLRWAIDAFANRKNNDGSDCTASFYLITKFIEKGIEPVELVKKSWRELYERGHGIALHTHNHPHGGKVVMGNEPMPWENLMTEEDWDKEIELSKSWLLKPYVDGPDLAKPDYGPGIPSEAIIGFRTPYLEFTRETFNAIGSHGFEYDCSIEEGFQGTDGTDQYWPYTMEDGSPMVNETFPTRFTGRELVDKFPNLWQMPVHAMIAPPDEECEKYGLEPGFRQRLKDRKFYFNTEDGLISGLDWNCWFEYSMTKQECLATLKYTLDKRLEGNRAPFMFGAHSDIYSSRYDEVDGQEYTINADYKERQECLEEFLDYALSKPEVRIDSVEKILAWMKDPKPLS